MEEGASPNIQNDYFNTARREKRRVAVLLNSGRRLTGRIRSFDKFTLLLETAQGEQMVFKHAIATVGPVAAAGKGARPRQGFGNRMPLGALKGGGDEEAPADAGGGGGKPASGGPSGHNQGSGGGTAPA